MSEPDAPLARRRRSVARLAAIQALYAMDVAGASADTAVQERLQPATQRAENGEVLEEPEPDFLKELVFGVSEQREALDRAIAGSLARGREFDRLEILLRSILRAGAYELANRLEIPRSVVINEYLELSHAFYSAKEPTLVNAVLDRLAHTLRDSHADRSIISDKPGSG